MANWADIIAGGVTAGLGTAQEQRAREDLLRREAEGTRQFDVLRQFQQAAQEETKRQHDMQYGSATWTNPETGETMTAPRYILPEVVRAALAKPKYQTAGELMDLGVLPTPDFTRTVEPSATPPEDYTDVRPQQTPAVIQDAAREASVRKTPIMPTTFSTIEKMMRPEKPVTLEQAVAPVLVKVQSGQPLTQGEQDAWDKYTALKKTEQQPRNQTPANVLADLLNTPVDQRGSDWQARYDEAYKAAHSPADTEMADLRKKRLKQQIDAAEVQKEAGDVISAINSGKPVATELVTRIQQRLIMGAKTFDAMYSSNPEYQAMFNAAKEEMLTQAAFLSAYIRKQRTGGDKVTKDTLSRQDSRYKQAVAKGLTDAQIESKFDIKLVD